MDAQTEFAVKKYFYNHNEMVVDKVYEDGTSEEVVFTNHYDLITEYNNAVDHTFYMPIR